MSGRIGVIVRTAAKSPKKKHHEKKILHFVSFHFELYVSVCFFYYYSIFTSTSRRTITTEQRNNEKKNTQRTTASLQCETPANIYLF